ncbi:MAG: ABC transporter ATP-binding protein [Bacteroidia bacterium]|nr:ABC transporter ATP-binding protein [Bacteroidia bacterium]
MIIQISHLGVNLNHQKILRDISLVFQPGIHYIVGLNGSGKTTLLHSLAGLLSYSGTILMDGTDISRISTQGRARTVAFVQQRLDIPFRIPVYEFLLTGRFPYLNWLGTYSAEDRQTVEESLQLLSLEPFRQRHLHEISGGELQKVLIARALIQQTPVLLLDEPAQSLDPRNKEFLFPFLKELSQKGKTIICTTHDLEPLEDESVFVTGIKSGQIVFSGKGGNIRSQLMRDVY